MSEENKKIELALGREEFEKIVEAGIKAIP